MTYAVFFSKIVCPIAQGLGESKLYKPSIEHDRRCVILCDGFYEWKKMEKTTTTASNSNTSQGSI